MSLRAAQGACGRSKGLRAGDTKGCVRKIQRGVREGDQKVHAELNWLKDSSERPLRRIPQRRLRTTFQKNSSEGFRRKVPRLALGEIGELLILLFRQLRPLRMRPTQPAAHQSMRTTLIEHRMFRHMPYDPVRCRTMVPPHTARPAGSASPPRQNGPIPASRRRRSSYAPGPSSAPASAIRRCVQRGPEGERGGPRAPNFAGFRDFYSHAIEVQDLGIRTQLRCRVQRLVQETLPVAATRAASSARCRSPPPACCGRGCTLPAVERIISDHI